MEISITQILAYTDDINIIGYEAEAFQGIEQAVENLGLQINESKTKYTFVTSATLPEFTYLGSKVSDENSMTAELHARMLAANRSFSLLLLAQQLLICVMNGTADLSHKS